MRGRDRKEKRRGGKTRPHEGGREEGEKHGGEQARGCQGLGEEERRRITGSEKIKEREVGHLAA